MAITPIDRTLRLLTLLAVRRLTPLSPPPRPRLPLQRRGRQTVVGLGGPVAISRDRLGIPTIHARAASDLFFGFGYAMAQDRLWQMDLYSLLGPGPLAAILWGR